MSWYIISYDIRDQKRLQRTHYYLKKEAIALQKSVFLVNSHQISKVKAIIKQYTKGALDDVRLYPITHPNAIWMAGIQAEALDGLNLNVIKPQKSANDNIFTRFLPRIFK